MTPHITYNAGKFYYDGNEIVNPEVLPPIPMDTLLDGKAILPATLRAEVFINCDKPCAGTCVECDSLRKFVRLVEVESKCASPYCHSQGECDCRIEPEKQAIDELSALRKQHSTVLLRELENNRLFKSEIKSLENQIESLMQQIEVRDTYESKQVADLREQLAAANKEIVRLNEWQLEKQAIDEKGIERLKSSQPPPAIDERVERLQRELKEANEYISVLHGKAGQYEMEIAKLKRSSQPPPQAERPLREHFEIETDAGTTLRTFDYIAALENYIDSLTRNTKP